MGVTSPMNKRNSLASRILSPQSGKVGHALRLAHSLCVELSQAARQENHNFPLQVPLVSSRVALDSVVSTMDLAVTAECTSARCAGDCLCPQSPRLGSCA